MASLVLQGFIEILGLVLHRKAPRGCEEAAGKVIRSPAPCLFPAQRASPGAMLLFLWQLNSVTSREPVSLGR